MRGWTEAYFWAESDEHKVLDVKLADGSVLLCVPYQGGGIFGAGSGLQDVARWRPHTNDLERSIPDRCEAGVAEIDAGEEGG